MQAHALVAAAGSSCRKEKLRREGVSKVLTSSAPSSSPWCGRTGEGWAAGSSSFR